MTRLAMSGVSVLLFCAVVSGATHARGEAPPTEHADNPFRDKALAITTKPTGGPHDNGGAYMENASVRQLGDRDFLVGTLPKRCANDGQPRVIWIPLSEVMLIVEHPDMESALKAYEDREKAAEEDMEEHAEQSDAAHAPSGNDGDVEKERQNFQGTWRVESVEDGGVKLPEIHVKDLTVIVEGDKYTVKDGDQVIQAATQKLDLSTSPKTRDITMVEGPRKGDAMLGIYELSGDTLKVCFDSDGTKRPTEFKSAKGSRTVLVVHKRVRE